MKHAFQSYTKTGTPRHATFARHPVAAAIAAAFFTVSGSAWGQLPTGAAVVNGTAGIVTNSSAMTVTNSPNAILNWNSFSIGNQNSVRFAQKNAASQVLNRVLGSDPSNILGSLSSNGGVWLVNPHGVLFGPNARIDVGGLVASTLGISNEDFLAGRFRFEAAGTKGGQVLNQGEITTTFGGHVWLIGDSVRNEGLVQSPAGNIVLAAGKSIELVDSGMPNVTVRVTAPETEALNLGSLLASADGSIDLHGGIVNQKGIVRADSIGTDVAGRIVIKAQGDTLVSGEVSAKSAGGKGGQVHLLGKNVGLVEQAAVDVSGARGGGEILVGGDYLGSNPQVANAQASFLGEGATLKANATKLGDGGRIIVWSNHASRVYGSIEARGAADGKGGFVETSGGYLDARAVKVDVGSDSGKGGTWLLDPNNITISNNDGNVNVTGGRPNFTSTDDDSIVSTSTINNALNIGGSVRVITGNGGTNIQQGNITVANNISKTSSNIASLFLLAQGDIRINPDVTINSSTPSALNVTLNSNIVSFDPDTGVVRFPPADGIGGISIDGSINAGAIEIAAGGRLPRGNHVEFNKASLTGTSLLIRAGTFTDPNSVNVNGSTVLLGTSTITISDSVVMQGESIIGQPTVVAGGPIRVFTRPLSGGQIQGGTWTSTSDAAGTAILLNTSAVSGATLNTPNGRWVVIGSSSPDRYQLQPSYVRVNQPLDLTVDQDYAARLGPETGVGNHGFVLTSPLNVGIRVNADRPYDGTPKATFNAGQVIPITGWSTLTANFSPESPIASTFSDKNANQNKTVTLPVATTSAGIIRPFQLTYKNVPVRGAGQEYSAAITQRLLTATATAANKVYDGTVAATVAVGQITPLVPEDNVSITGAVGAFNDKNVGTAKPVTVSGGSLTGTDAGNYQLVGLATTAADITLKIVAPLVIADNKVYDATRTAIVRTSLPGIIPGDDVSLNNAMGLFDNKNAGIGKTVTVANGSLAGADKDNYSLTRTGTTTANITRKPVTINMTSNSTRPVVKEYDATAVASFAADQFVLNGIAVDDAVFVAGPIQGNYDSANVGMGKLVTATGPFQISGVDALNYSVQGINLMNAAPNMVDGTVSGNVGTITPATLVYNADPAVRALGFPIVGLTGKVKGFKGADNLASATLGSLGWQSRNATVDSLPGAYPIEGVGLAADNYVFTQAPGNATALVLIPTNTFEAPQQQVVKSSNSAVNAAVNSVNAAIGTRDIGGGVFDISSPTANKDFSPINIASMGQDELAQLLESRKDFKRKLFANAIYKLEIDPSLADVQPCASVADAGSGLCRIVTVQLDDIHTKNLQANPAPKGVKAKTARLPQIERKVAVLFGINDYDDKTIPRLENAVPDVEAVSKMLQDKLGYDVKVVQNPNKADIIRTFNELATQINSSDSVVVYYAGHGYSLEKNGAGYWLPFDASANDPTKWISNSDIAKLLASIRSQQMALISDSCYSGAFARDGMASVGRGVTADDVLTKRSVVVLSSGGDEPVTDEGKDGHSIFAWNLMKAIGSVDNWRPGSTIFEEVQREVKKEFPQTPRYGSVTSAGHQQGGDYLFELR